MKYYKVKPQCGDKHIYKMDKYGRLKQVISLIANELFTPKEFEKLCKGGIVNENYFEVVETSKKSVYWCFGARFA